MPPSKTKKSRASHKKTLTNIQRTYYVAAEYMDQGDRLLVEDGDNTELYSINLKLAQYWYAAAWRGERLDLAPFQELRLDWAMDMEQAESI